MRLPGPLAEAEGADADLPTALGWLYVAEGSNLGAAFLIKEAEKLGLSETHGARHLAAIPKAAASTGAASPRRSMKRKCANDRRGGSRLPAGHALANAFSPSDRRDHLEARKPAGWTAARRTRSGARVREASQRVTPDLRALFRRGQNP